jgi:Ca2+-binding RTX toxin-like protein
MLSRFRGGARRKSGMRNLIRTAIVTAALFAAFAGQAQAATTVGQHAPTPADVTNGGCTGGSVYMTVSPDYAFPQGGVLTSWSVQGDDIDIDLEPDDQLKLKIVEQVSGNTYRVVAEDPITRNIALNTLNTFQVRIPVEAGQLLALWVESGGHHPCSYVAPGGDGLWGSAPPEPAVGEEFTIPTVADVAEDQLNVSARLEPDCDNDQFGDETQDTDTRSCNPPPTAVCQNATVNKLDGTEGDDNLVGTINADAIFGLGGNDELDGVDGDDCLDAGEGDDRASGGADNDLVKGGDGRDRVRGTGGEDRLKGQGGVDRVNGGEGSDKLSGGPGADKLNGGAAKDRYKGNGGDDDINAVDAKRDRVNCGAGDDKAVVDAVDRVSANCETVREVNKD